MEAASSKLQYYIAFETYLMARPAIPSLDLSSLQMPNVMCGLVAPSLTFHVHDHGKNVQGP